jgi:hypothetical protein
MTDCNPKPVVFSSLKGRQVVADFAGGSLTSDAGALLLREADRKLGLTKALDKVIPDPRNQDLIVHQQTTLLRQRIYGLALGYEDVNDQQTLREDPLMQLVTERGLRKDLPLASPPTICRLENRIARPALVDMSKVLVETFIASFAEPPKELILDFDATNDPIHGDQAGRFFHGYYDEYCFLPLYVFCGSQLLVAYLRPSNIDAAKHSWAILSLLVQRFRQVWPTVQIIFRGDSGFCRWKMFRWCERHGVDYLVGMAKNSRLLALAGPLMEQAKKQYEATGEKQRLFTWLEYAAGSWDQKRRLIAKAEHDQKGENPRFVVTTLQGEAQPIYDDLYCARGEAENRIKEQQLGLYADRTSCHDFEANQFRVLLSAAAYVLLDHLRRNALAGTELATAQVSTIRLKLLKIGARLVCSARRIVLHLAGGYPLQQLFRQIAERLRSTTSTA